MTFGLFFTAIFIYATSTPDHPYLPNIERPVYIFGSEYDSVRGESLLRTQHNVISFKWILKNRVIYHHI